MKWGFRRAVSSGFFLPLKLYSKNEIENHRKPLVRDAPCTHLAPQNGSNVVVLEAILKTDSQNHNVTVERMFASMLPSSFDSMPVPKLHSTCAVVGSSAVLLGEGLGRQIDRAEAVFRVNFAPVDSFERDVGARTTYRVGTVDMSLLFKHASFVHIQAFFCSEEQQRRSCWDQIMAQHCEWCLTISPDVMAKLAPFTEDLYIRSGLQDTERVLSTLNCTSAAAMLVARQHSSQKLWNVSNAGRSWFSSGFLAVFAALSLCRSVDVFGFGPSVTLPEHLHAQDNITCADSRKPYARYYHSTREMMISESVCQAGLGHPFAIEHELYIRMHLLGLINFHSAAQQREQSDISFVRCNVAGL